MKEPLYPHTPKKKEIQSQEIDLCQLIDRLARVEWAYDEVAQIKGEWGFPNSPPEYGVAAMKHLFGKSLSTAEEAAIDEHRKNVLQWEKGNPEKAQVIIFLHDVCDFVSGSAVPVGQDELGRVLLSCKPGWVAVREATQRFQESRGRKLLGK